VSALCATGRTHGSAPTILISSGRYTQLRLAGRGKAAGDIALEKSVVAKEWCAAVNFYSRPTPELLNVAPTPVKDKKIVNDCSCRHHDVRCSAAECWKTRDAFALSTPEPEWRTNARSFPPQLPRGRSRWARGCDGSDTTRMKLYVSLNCRERLQDRAAPGQSRRLATKDRSL